MSYQCNEHGWLNLNFSCPKCHTESVTTFATDSANGKQIKTGSIDIGPDEFKNEPIITHELHPPVSEGMWFVRRDFDNHIVGCCGGKLCTNQEDHEWTKAEAASAANAKLSRILAQGVRVWFCDGELKTVHLVQPVDAARTGIVVAIEEVK